MAALVASSRKFIEISVDALTDFDMANDLVAMGLARNPTDGIRIKKITFIPSAVGDTIIIRDGENGPRIFSAINVLGTYDILKDEYFDNKEHGKRMSPYIDAGECTISVADHAYVIFEL